MVGRSIRPTISRSAVHKAAHKVGRKARQQCGPPRSLPEKRNGGTGSSREEKFPVPPFALSSRPTGAGSLGLPLAVGDGSGVMFLEADDTQPALDPHGGNGAGGGIGSGEGREGHDIVLHRRTADGAFIVV